MEKDYGRTDSYRVAVTPSIPDDGRNTEGRPKSRRRRPPSRGSRSTVNEELEDMRTFIDMDEHKISLDALYTRYATDPNMGLSAMRVKELYEVFGPNQITPAPKVPSWVIFCKNLFGGFSLILWIACVLCLVTFSIQSDLLEQPPYENLVLGIIIVIIILLTSIFSFYQEMRGIKIMEELRKPLPQFVNVVREGRKMVLNAKDIVMGDVVDLKAGEKIPADIRIISSRNFKVDNSLLNGDLEPQLRSNEFTHEDPLETMNMAYASASAIEGSCRGVVVATGDRTLVGRFMTTVEFRYPESSLITEVTCVMQTLTSIGIILGLIFFLVSFLFRFNWIDALIFLIGIILAIVPEGLLAVVTVSLILTANRMYAKNCLVKELDSIETLGRVSSILVDKSRALTKGQLSLAHMWIDGNIHTIDTSEKQNVSAETYVTTPTFKALINIAALCNSASLSNEEETPPGAKKQLPGDEYDAALLKLVEFSNFNAVEMRTRNRKVCEIPFNSSSRYQLTIHETQDPHDPSYMLMVKGAPEQLLDLCSTILIGEQQLPLNAKLKEAFSNAFIEFASNGESVIGFCDYKLPLQKFPPGYPFDAEDQNFPLAGYRFVGLVSLQNNIRPSIPDAVGKCRTAGIRVVMCTGDHAITAKAIARQCGLFTGNSQTVEDIAIARGVPVEQVAANEANSTVLHGSDLKDITRERLDYLLCNHRDIIFARLSLSQKLHVVEALKSLGGIVAVTGFGVCDAPALRKADLGIALGGCGDDVVKDAGDLILLDDNFATIVTGIEEGRLIFENLRKAVAYLITTNMPEVWPFFLFLIFGLPLPLGALTILIIDLGTDVLPAISLTFEKPEHDVMSVDPRNPISTRLIDINVIDVRNGQIGMIEMAAGIFAYFVVMGENGFWLQDLLFKRRAWDSVGVSDFKDSYNQEWTYERRKYLEWTCHSAFFISIVMCQWMNLLCCKAKNKLIYQQGCRNHVLTFAFFFETLLALVLLYVPGMGIGFRMFPLKINWWIPAVPYALTILIYDEARTILKVKFREKFKLSS